MLPHQAAIRELFVSADAAGALARDAAALAVWVLTQRQLVELDLLLHGGFYPLKGFTTEADQAAIQERMRLPHGLLWPVPVGLDVAESFAATVEPGDDIALRDGTGSLLALLSVTDKWRPAPAAPIRLGGKVTGLRAPDLPKRQTPNRLRALFRMARIERVVAIAAGQAIPPNLADTPATMLLVQPAADLPPNAIPLPLPITTGSRGRLLQALILRNHGATNLLAAPDDPPELAALYAEAGLTLLSPARR